MPQFHDNQNFISRAIVEEHLVGDIYVSNRPGNGRLGSGRQPGTNINTPYNEESPFPSGDDKTLYFSSRDIKHRRIRYFYSTLEEAANGRSYQHWLP